VSGGRTALAAGQLAEAAWAAEQGLRTSPYEERLFRVLMRVANARGSRAGVRAVMERLAQVLEKTSSLPTRCTPRRGPFTRCSWTESLSGRRATLRPTGSFDMRQQARDWARLSECSDQRVSGEIAKQDETGRHLSRGIPTQQVCYCFVQAVMKSSSIESGAQDAPGALKASAVL